MLWSRVVVRPTKLGCLALVLAMGLAGCGPRRPAEPPAQPPPAYSGPAFLRTTVGSMTMVNGFRRQLVSGYGLVVGLDGTGSSDVPPALREWLINEMARRGFGRESMGYAHMSPRRVLASDSTAVVLVEGLMPPGAVAGARFDVRVSALPQTQTTSLVGGRLYTTELSIRGRNTGRSSLPKAIARGDLFSNPFLEDDAEGRYSGPADPRSGRILGGGVVQEDALMALSLRQPSYKRSRLIEQRINGRFPQAPEDPDPMAVAKSDELVQINVLKRFRDDPKRMLELVNASFLNPTDKFNRLKAGELIKVLAKPENEQYAEQVTLAWEAMGKIILPVLRSAYDHPKPVVRFAALEAGARLGDRKTLEPLRQAAISDESGRADRATAMLGKLLKHHPEERRLIQTLREQLEHEDAFVRFAAFDALAREGDPTVVTRRFGDRFELAMVRSSRPMIYVTRRDAPRVVVFNQMLGFEPPVLFTHGDNELMLRLEQGQQQLAVRYRPPGESRGKTYKIPATVGNLVYLLGSQPTADDPSPGFGMRYSRVARILNALTEAGHVEAPFVLQQADLRQRLAKQRKQSDGAPIRPETTGPALDSRPGSESGAQTDGEARPESDGDGQRPASDAPSGGRPGNIVPLEESGDDWLE